MTMIDLPGSIRALEFYSGIGGLHLALTRSNADATVVQAFDWDQMACQVYSLNHGPNIVSKVDISTLTPEYLTTFHADLWLLSPACQPYTVLNSNAKGASDPRAKSFLYLVQDVLPRMKASGTNPSYVLVENVAGFESSTARTVLRSMLRSLGYRTLELLLTPLQFGIPNSRLRYYLLAKRRPLRFACDADDQDRVWRCIPGQRGDCEGTETHADVDQIRHYLDHFKNDQPYRVPDKVLQRWGRLFDIVLPSSKRSCCFTRGYTQLVERAGSIIQMNEELDQTTVFDEFLAAQKTDNVDAVKILYALRLRYFSPTELLRLFSFEKPFCEKQFQWPEMVTLKTKYRLIGNSINIRVVTELLNYMFLMHTQPLQLLTTSQQRWLGGELFLLAEDVQRSSRGQRATEDMGLEAATKALLDAGITYDAIETAFVGYCYGDSTSGQRALYNLGLTYIPIVNVNNNCSTGSTALYLANLAVKNGQVECAMALGFERMKPGSLSTNFPDRPSPMQLSVIHTHELERGVITENHGPLTARMFDNGAQEYFTKYGGNVEHLAKIASKNHKHSLNNPYSQFRDGWSMEQVLAAPKMTNNLTKFMCSPTSDGAACCIVASEEFVHSHALENQAIEIVAQELATDGLGTYENKSPMELVGYKMTEVCTNKVFDKAGHKEGEGRNLVGVIELHDCFAANELITYPALGLCPPGEAHKLVDRGDNTYGGKYVINPSGGLEAKGHPLGATGIGMHFYIMMQLRNWAGPMQAPGLFNIPDKRGKYGLVHNIGLGGAAVVSLLRRPEFFKPGGPDGRTRLGYNHAYECRSVSMKDVNKVKSKEASAYVLQHAKL
ncbi:hypothetical protein AX15_005739 [Amanita polypyramis BW_CC]|nr:hypothetical protein AX15_005739 [Amanita polypyramis BW_CC]